MLLAVSAMAHPMPNSYVLLNVAEKEVQIILQLPVPEFELAFGQALSQQPQQILPKYDKAIRDYVLAHTRLQTNNGAAWQICIDSLHVVQMNSLLNGQYTELVVKLAAMPPANGNTRAFTIQYDAVMHQVASHYAVVYIHQDFANGILPADSVQLGVIQVDVQSNVVQPFVVNLNEGSQWKGFQKMIYLGMAHIRAGTDHLLFLLLLLLIAPLLSGQSRQWGEFGGWKYALKRIVGMVTAFTLGHSLTLLLISFYPLPRLAQTIEILIAFTIIMSAIHAYKPLFYRHEALIALIFGLIHGSAFASTLSEFTLQGKQLLWCVAGFNIGIEIMQLGIVILFTPLIALTRYPQYHLLRKIGAAFGGLAGVYWVLERLFAF